VHLFLAQGMQEGSVAKEQCLEILDRLLTTAPKDGIAAVSVGEQLAAMGEDRRAEAWLRLACLLGEPPARALEGLGIMLANRGELIEARNLWLKGVMSDGHPDFFAHLARLAFCDGDEVEGWDKALRGLRRISERCLRPSEWNEESARAGILLQYLAEHLADLEAPEDVHVALLDLTGLLQDPEDRVDLGLCFKEIDRLPEAERELSVGLPHVQDRDRRDAGARALLALTMPGFEKRFAGAVDLATAAASPEAALAEFAAFSEAVPSFWPAWFFKGVALRRLGRLAEARTCLERALAMRGDQPETLNELSVVCDELGDTARALELVGEAQRLRPDEAVYHVNRAIFLGRVGRTGDALAELERARELDPSDPMAKKVEKEFRERPQ
jgi:Flp pilus assembly protein TadD